MSADIVNLRQRRKRQARDDAEARAAGNRARYGRTRGERELETLEEQRARRAHDAAKLTDKPGE